VSVDPAPTHSGGKNKIWGRKGDTQSKKRAANRGNGQGPCRGKVPYNATTFTRKKKRVQKIERPRKLTQQNRPSPRKEGVQSRNEQEKATTKATDLSTKTEHIQGGARAPLNKNKGENEARKGRMFAVERNSRTGAGWGWSRGIRRLDGPDQGIFRKII